MSEEDERLRIPNVTSGSDQKVSCTSSSSPSFSATAASSSTSSSSWRLHLHPSHLHPRLSRSRRLRIYQTHRRHLQQQDVGRKVCRKYRQVYIRSLQQQEYNKLLNIVPSLASSRHKQRIPKVTVIEETIRYIDQLHEALAERVENETGGRLKITTEAVAEAAKDMFVDDATSAIAAAAAGSIPSFGGCGNKCAVCESDRESPKTKSPTLTKCTTDT